MTNNQFGCILSLYSEGVKTMGYFSNIEVEVMDLAHEGFSPLTISTMVKLPLEEVFRILTADADFDPEIDQDVEFSPYDTINS